MRPIRNAVTLVVDGREVTAPEGTMLVDAAKLGDIEIPVFCYEPKLGDPVGACRMCLVEIEGIPKLQTACSTPVRDGMVVYTRNDRVAQAQNAVVEFLLVNHPLDCPVCDKGGECPLQDIAMGWGPGRSRVTDPKRHFQKPVELSPLVAIDRERCILCYRCVRFSQEVAEDEQLQLLERGDRSYVGTFNDSPYIAPFHGNIIELCPVGALTSYTYRFRARPWEIEDAGSICTLCPSQCNVRFTVRDEQVKRVMARDNEEVDDGWLCDKGRFSFQMINSEERLSGPMVRAGGNARPAGWEEAIATAADGLRAAGGAGAAIVGGGASNEEGWLVQRIVRGALGSPHVAGGAADGLSRQALMELSRPDRSASMGSIDFAEAVLVVGVDPMHAAPILDLRIRKALRRSGTQLALATDRPTSLDGGALEAVRYAPGDDAAFLVALAGALGAKGYAEGGAYAEEAERAASVIRGAPDTVIVWGERTVRGADGEAAAAALAAISRALGHEGRHGCGLLEVPEGANGRGLREVGCVPSAGPGLTETAQGGTAAEIRVALEAGELKVLILFDVDPVRDLPDAEAWQRALGAADFVLAVSAFGNQSTGLADVILPAETHAEKDGTITHPDGRLQRLRPSVPHLADVRMGWQWLLELSAALGQELNLHSGPMVLSALADDVPFYAGITHEEIGGTGVRWQERPAASSLSAAGAGPEGPPAPPTPPTESGNGGLRLGTYRDLWSGEVPERNPALRFLSPRQTLEVAPADADRLGLAGGEQVEVSVNGSRVGATVAIRERMPAGSAFLIEGTRENNANLLTNGVPQVVEVTKAE